MRRSVIWGHRAGIVWSTSDVFSRDPGSSTALGRWVEVGKCRSRRLVTRASLVRLGGRRGDPQEVDTFELTVCCLWARACL